MAYHASATAPLGKKFGRLTIIGLASPHVYQSGRKEQRWIARCDCGEYTVAIANNIRAGRTTSCNRHGHGNAKEMLSYNGAHQRVRRVKGRASQHACVDGCGRMARHWSYNHQDPKQLWAIVTGFEVPYSTNPDFYEPRCYQCHHSFDKEHKAYSR